MGFALLLALTLLAAIAAVAVGVRLYADEGSRSEVALAAATTWLVLIQAPVHALGWLGRLDATTLALASLGVSLATFVGAHAGRQPLAQLHRTWRGLVDTLLLPWSALVEAWRARSIATLALAAGAAVVCWTFLLAWLAPSSSWDGLWYHESMVGFALQNRGFGWVPLPDYMQAVNGYARNSEHFLVWVTIFADRRLVDAVPSVISPILVLGFFCLARRYVRWRLGAMALGVVFLLTPGVVLQLRSTYVDLIAVVSFVLALYWATKPAMRGRDVWLAGLALALVGGSKSTGIFFMGLLGLASTANVLVSSARRRSGWPLLHGLGALAVIVALAGPTYLRNFERFGNPLWPLRFRIKKLDVDWPGPQDVQDQQYPLSQVLDYMYGPPSPGHDFADTRMHGYGHVLPYLGIPLALLGFALLVWRCVEGQPPGADLRGLAAAGDAHGAAETRHRGARRERATRLSRAGPWHLLGVLLLVAISVLPSPAYWWSRFQLQAIGAVLLLICWLADRAWGSPWREGVAGALVVGSILPLFWFEPGWDVPLERVEDLLHLTAAERAVSGRGFCQLPPETAAAREGELAPGDVVAFTDHPFPANLWNERMSNRVVWVQGLARETYLAELEAAHAKWAVVRTSSAQARALAAAHGAWEIVGSAGEGFAAYRRGASTPGSTAGSPNGPPNRGGMDAGAAPGPRPLPDAGATPSARRPLHPTPPPATPARNGAARRPLNIPEPLVVPRGNVPPPGSPRPRETPGRQPAHPDGAPR